MLIHGILKVIIISIKESEFLKHVQMIIANYDIMQWISRWLWKLQY